MFASFNARAVGLPHLTAETTVNLAAESGFAGVDLMARDIFQSGANNPQAIRSRMNDLGIRGGAFPCPVDWRRDEASFQKGLAELPRIAEVASLLGLTRTGTWVMPETWERPAGAEARQQHHKEVVALHIDRLGAMARVLDGFGIQLGLEVIGVESFRNGQGEPFIHRIDALDRELPAIWDESPNLGIVLDVFHLYAANEPIEAGLSWNVNRVVWVHVADLAPQSPPDRSQIVDANRGLPGDNGNIDVRGFLQRLADEGYDGPVTAEPLANCPSLVGQEPQAIARRVKQSLDDVWPYR